MTRSEGATRHGYAAPAHEEPRSETSATEPAPAAYQGLSLQTMMNAGGNQTMAALGSTGGREEAGASRTEGADATHREGEDATQREPEEGDAAAAATAATTETTTTADSADGGDAADAGDDADAAAPAAPVTVSLNTSAAQLDLGDSATLTATVANGTATAYKFQIRRAAGAWADISSGAASSYTGVARVAGNLSLRVVATVDSAEVNSGEAGVAVRFPDFAAISGDATVRGFCDASWAATKAATTATTRREEGFWIQLNTQSMTYQKTATVVGPTRNNDQGASVNFGARAPDSPASPAPNAHAIYTVASFHTHTPMTHRTGTRVTGPSGADQRIDRSDDVCGLVYDWSANPAVAGHPLTDPAQIYHSGPARRSTPA